MGAAGHYLLGVVARRSERRDLAQFHFSAALAADPFLWVAYEELCGLGATDEAAALLNGAYSGLVASAASAEAHGGG